MYVFGRILGVLICIVFIVVVIVSNIVVSFNWIMLFWWFWMRGLVFRR